MTALVVLLFLWVAVLAWLYGGHHNLLRSLDEELEAAKARISALEQESERRLNSLSRSQWIDIGRI